MPFFLRAAQSADVKPALVHSLARPSALIQDAAALLARYISQQRSTNICQLRPVGRKKGFRVILIGERSGDNKNFLRAGRGSPAAPESPFALSFSLRAPRPAPLSLLLLYSPRKCYSLWSLRTIKQFTCRSNDPRASKAL